MRSMFLRPATPTIAITSGEPNSQHGSALETASVTNVIITGDMGKAIM